MKRLFPFIMGLCILLTGCSSKDKEESQNTVNNFLTAYQKLDKNAGTYIFGTSNEIKFNGIQKNIAEKMKYTIESVTKEDDHFVVNVKITTLDFKEIFEEVKDTTNETMTEDEIIQILNNMMIAEDAKTREFDVSIPVIKNGDSYYLEITSELSNALFGGYNEYLSELTGGAYNE